MSNVTPGTLLVGLFRSYKKDIDWMRQQLKSLEAGRMRLGERKIGATAWTDITQREIKRLKVAIAEYEAILAEYEKG
jgi:hypothetical protein